MNIDGLNHWKMQRLSAITLFFITICLAFFIFSNQQPFDNLIFQLNQNNYFKTLVLFWILIMYFHAYLGVEMIITDYLKNTSLIITIQYLLLAHYIGSFIFITVGLLRL